MLLNGVSLVLELLIILGFTFVLLRTYANWRRQPLVVLAITLISWYFCFIIVAVLPLDVSLTFYEKCLLEYEKQRGEHNIYGSTWRNTIIDSDNEIHNEKRMRLLVRTTQIPSVTPEYREPDINVTVTQSGLICQKPTNYVTEKTLLTMWGFVYWTAQILCWLVLPIMQSYYTAGDFSVFGKIKTAIYENILIYSSYLLIFGILLMYAAAKGLTMDAEHFKIIGITASNTWGLFILVALLGYGLIELPRQVWHSSSIAENLQKTYFLVDKLSTEKTDAEEALRDAYRDASQLFGMLPEQHPYRTYIEEIMKKFPIELTEHLIATEQRRARNITHTEVNDVAHDIKYLTRLNKRAISSYNWYNRTQAQWTALVEHAVHLEDVQRNEEAGDYQFVRTTPTNRHLLFSLVCTPTTEYIWYCMLKRPLLKLAGFCMALLSGIVIWSECTFFLVHPTMSLTALFVNTAAQNYDYNYIEISSLVIILYMSLAAYYTVFKLKVFEYYHLDPHQHTDSNSLLFSGMLLCRLTPPLCLNFLGMIHLDSHVTRDANFGTETAFTKLMGNLDVLPVVANGLNVYLPIWIMLLCAATWMRFGERLLHAIGIDQFINDNMTCEMCAAGKALVALDRNRRSKGQPGASQSEVRRIRHKYGASTGDRASEMRERHADRKHALDLSPLDDGRETVTADRMEFNAAYTDDRGFYRALRTQESDEESTDARNLQRGEYRGPRRLDMSPDKGPVNLFDDL